MITRSLVLTLTLLAACKPPDRPAPADTPAPATVSLEQFQGLRWLEGTWRGAEAAGAPFFERYQFLDDSTLRRYSFTDSTLAQISDSGRTSLRGSRVIGGDAEPRWEVTSFDSVSWHFESLRDPGRAFTWSRNTADTWTATLTWPDPQGNAQERVYTLVRLAP